MYDFFRRLLYLSKSQGDGRKLDYQISRLYHTLLFQTEVQVLNSKAYLCNRHFKYCYRYAIKVKGGSWGSPRLISIQHTEHKSTVPCKETRLFAIFFINWPFGNDLKSAQKQSFLQNRFEIQQKVSKRNLAVKY